MSSLTFTRKELAAALARGVRQCVVIGSRPPFREAFHEDPDRDLQVFTLNDEPVVETAARFVPTQFETETLEAALEKSEFDRLKATLFVWLGGAGYRTLEGAVSALRFMATLPKGSGVVFDYAVERTAAGFTQTALDGLASRLVTAGGSLKYLIQPQAVGAMLRGLGFRQILDLAEEDVPSASGHLVSAVV